MQDHRFDMLILGTGTAGQLPAYRAARAGKSVAMIESREPGGTCANRGCDAKKPFVNAAHVVHAAERLTGHGIKGELRGDWAQAMQFKRTFTEDIGERTRRDLTDAGITLFEGTPRFADRLAVEVERAANHRRTRS